MFLVADEVVDHQAERCLLKLLRDVKATHLSEGGLEKLGVDRFLRCILEPLVLEGVLGEGAIGIINCKQILYQALTLLTNVWPDATFHGVLANLYSLYDLVIGLAVEWWASRQQDIHKDANGPDITPLVIVLLQDLGRNVIRSTVHLLQLCFLLVVLDRRSEVDDFQCVVIIFIINKILRLQVTVHHAETVAIRYGLQYLPYYLRGLVFGKSDLLLDGLEQLHARAELCHQEVVDLVLEDFEDL